MSELANYLLEHHLSEMSNEANGNVEAAALEVIKTQDAKIAEFEIWLKKHEKALDRINNILATLPILNNALR